MRKLFRRVRVRAKRRLIANGAGQVAGAAGLVYGLWQVYEPLAWMVGGAALLLVSFASFGETK